MAKYRDGLPQLSGEVFIAYTGIETDLIFGREMDLPGFASYPLLETEEGREILLGYYENLIEVARRAGTAVLLDTVTWVANRDRGAAIGFGEERLSKINLAAVNLAAEARERYGDLPSVLSAQMGPRGDGYAPGEIMSEAEAEAYHAEQMETLARSEADLVSAFTISYPEEATGIVRAARKLGMPVAIAFTVETDGRLPTGMPLSEAIETVDARTERGAAYFLVNCAHPDHFAPALSDAPWASRLRGCVANASRCSHAELDNATELDDGDPEELAAQIGGLRRRYPNLTILGGCCGTDMRHLRRIAEESRRGVAGGGPAPEDAV